MKTEALKNLIRLINETKVTVRQQNFYRYEAVTFLRGCLCKYDSVIAAWEDVMPAADLKLCRGGYDYVDYLLYRAAVKEDPEYCETMVPVDEPTPLTIRSL